ncbi:MAG: IS66 family transposase [Planctomycetota bacterium]
MDKDDLPNDVNELKRLLLQSQRKAAQLTSVVDELSATVDDQRKTIASSDAKIRELLQALRGKTRERVNPDQLVLFEIGELETIKKEESEPARPNARRKKRRGRRIIPDNLPSEEVLYELPEEERRCPHDGKPMRFIRFETSKQLEYVPAKMKVIVHKRAVYACADKHDDAKPLIAPKPPQPIEKGLAAPGLLAQVVVSKFGDHLPGYRLEDIFSRHGVDIRRSTIYDWLSGTADLCKPLYEQMKSRVLESKVLHTDDTQVKLIDTSMRSTKLARFWAYLGDRGHPYTVFDFTETRERAGPEKFLRDFEGYLQADAYGGYDGLYLGSRGAIQEVACWAHCRRYWHKAREQDPTRAHYALGAIAGLYEIERSVADADPQTRSSVRKSHARPILVDLKTWLDGEEFLPKSLIGKAATYTRNQWEGLNRYIDDGDLSIDNNRAERAMKSVALGRKAWLFVGSPAAGERASVLMSLIHSCKENHVEPWAYLQSVLKQLPLGINLDRLLPDRWLSENPKHRWEIADRRKQERAAKG